MKIILTYTVPRTPLSREAQRLALESVVVPPETFASRRLSLIESTVEDRNGLWTRIFVLSPERPETFESEQPGDENKRALVKDLLTSFLQMHLFVGSGVTETIEIVPDAPGTP